MPSGRTHDRITLWLLPGITLLSFILTQNGELTLLVASTFLFSGLMFGPDLDIYSVQYKRWGWFRWIWLPYQKSIGHRSRWSHGLFLGTTLRVGYFTLLVSLISILGIGLAQTIWGFSWNWQEEIRSIVTTLKQYPQEVTALFIGLEAGAMSHTLTDYIGSKYRKIKKKGLKEIFSNGQKKRKKTTKRKRRSKSRKKK